MTLQVGWVSPRREEKSTHKDFTTEVVENINNEIKILPVTRTLLIQVWSELRCVAITQP